VKSYEILILNKRLENTIGVVRLIHIQRALALTTVVCFMVTLAAAAPQVAHPLTAGLVALALARTAILLALRAFMRRAYLILRARMVLL